MLPIWNSILLSKLNFKVQVKSEHFQQVLEGNDEGTKAPLFALGLFTARQKKLQRAEGRMWPAPPGLTFFS